MIIIIPVLKSPSHKNLLKRLTTILVIVEGKQIHLDKDQVTILSVRKYKCVSTMGIPVTLLEIAHIVHTFPTKKQGWQNMPRGRSSKSNASRSCSRSGDWNAKKAKNQTPKDKRDMSDKKPNLRDGSAKSISVRSNSSQGSSSSSHS